MRSSIWISPKKRGKFSLLALINAFVGRIT